MGIIKGTKIMRGIELAIGICNKWRIGNKLNKNKRSNRLFFEKNLPVLLYYNNLKKKKILEYYKNDMQKFKKMTKKWNSSKKARFL